MLVLEGKYTEARVFADIVDDVTKGQVQTLIDQPFMENIKVRIMADCHAGAGCVIGTTLKVKDKIVPNLVGVDVGCGMLCIKLGKIDIDFKILDNFIRLNIPSGQNVNDKITITDVDIEDLRCYKELKNHQYLKRSLGSLGGGNHFIEIDVNSDGQYYLIIHSGSRNLGKQMAEYYQNKAIEYHENKLMNKEEAIRKIINEYKQTGREKEIDNKIKLINSIKVDLSFPKELAFLEGKDFEDYIFDMNICQKYASENRLEMAKRILTLFKLNIEEVEKFETIHNYINMEDMILRKGSVSAYKDQLLLIPINMRDGCIIAMGKSNPEYNYSAPHGAGRIMSRTEAIRKIKLEDFKDAMTGVFSTTINAATIDESPFVYKPIESILKNIEETVEIKEIIKPVYNFKASE